MILKDLQICLYCKTVNIVLIWETYDKLHGFLPSYQGFPDGSVVKNPPAMQEMWVQSLGQEDAQEEKMVTYSSILAWKIPWTEESGRL